MLNYFNVSMHILCCNEDWFLWRDPNPCLMFMDALRPMDQPGFEVYKHINHLKDKQLLTDISNSFFYFFTSDSHT